MSPGCRRSPEGLCCLIQADHWAAQGTACYSRWTAGHRRRCSPKRLNLLRCLDPKRWDRLRIAFERLVLFRRPLKWVLLCYALSTCPFRSEETVECSLAIRTATTFGSRL